MLRLNFIGSVLKNWTKVELQSGSFEYTVRIKISESYADNDGKQKFTNNLVMLKVYRKAENCIDFENDLKVSKKVYGVCEMPTVNVGKNADTNELYGYFSSRRTIQFIFIDGNAEEFLRMQGIGGIVSDAQIQNLKDGVRKAINFTTAHSEKAEGIDANGYPNQNVVFVNGAIFRAGEKTSIAQYLAKGTKVFVEGKPVIRVAIDKAGNERAYFNAEFFGVEFIGGSKKDTAPLLPKTDEHSDMPENENFGENDDLPF